MDFLSGVVFIFVDDGEKRVVYPGRYLFVSY
jgi:hypothetical protein